MSEAIVSVRVDASVHAQMQLHDEINWSGIVRNAIDEQLEKMESIDSTKAKYAAKQMDELRKKGTFAGGKTGVEIIREWREKRR